MYLLRRLLARSPFALTPAHLSHATNTKELPHKRNHAEPGSSVSHRPGRHCEVQCNKAAEPCPSCLSGLCATSAAFILGVLLRRYDMSLGCLFAWLTGGLAFPTVYEAGLRLTQPKITIDTALLQHSIRQCGSHHVPRQKHCLSHGAWGVFCLPWSSLLTGWLFRADWTWSAVIAGGVPLVHLPHHLRRVRGALLRHGCLLQPEMGVAAHLLAHWGRLGGSCARAARPPSDATQQVSNLTFG